MKPGLSESTPPKAATPSSEAGLDHATSADELTPVTRNVLTPTELAHYHREGWVVVRHVLATHEVFALRAACDEIEKAASAFIKDEFLGSSFFALHRRSNPFAKNAEHEPPVPGLLRRVAYPYAVNATLDRFRTHPRLLGAAAQILGDDLVQIVNQVNFNPPGGGAGWGWHQDYRFRKPGMTEPVQQFVQTLTALDLCSPFTGGLRVIPRSHEIGPLALDADNENAERYFDAKTAVQPEMRPGDAIFFNAYVIHGSTPNLSPGPRRVYINGYGLTSLPYGKPVLANGRIVPAAARPMEYEGDRELLPRASKY